MKRIIFLCIAAAFLLVFNQCKKDSDDTPQTHVVNSMSDMKVTDEFDFQTSKRISVSFTDAFQRSTSQVKYEVYLYDTDNATEDITFLDENGETVSATVPVFDVQNNKVATVISSNSEFSIDLTIPEYYDELYVVRNEMGMYSTSIISVNQNRAAYNRAALARATEDATDIFYAVNGYGDVLTINQTTGEMAKISDIPSNGGSYACAINPATKRFYTITHSGGSKLYEYDIVNDSWEKIGNVGISGPRLGYNQNDGMLYYSTSRYVYVIDPSNANIISSYIIDGLQTTSGGDLTFDSDGTMYISSTTGLYRCEFGNSNRITATWISSESLPNYPNSLTFDSNNQLWWATVTGGEGRVFIMDKTTGGWENRFNPYSYYIHDLATLPYDENTVPETDTDGDGVIDFYDEYPNDNNKASSTYTPSIFGWGTYAFEDLWPYKGDYDFNDLVVNYRYTNIQNAQGLLVETKLNFNVKNVGGSYKNGFGIELNMDEALISNVTGYKLTENIVQLNSKGLEVNQAKPTIIVFDNSWENTEGNSELELTISYNGAIDPNNFNVLNPFIFIDGERGREAHLSNKAPTSLANQAYFSTADDVSSTTDNIFYKDQNYLPWGIDIIHDFVPPKEKSEIILGYPFFVQWAESGGSNYNDWYKEKTGYRNYNHLKQN